MTSKGQATIRVKWVRSGIGFSFRQKEMVRSLGLGRLNQVVERPDTPQIRGLVAKIPHLVEIVEAAKQSAAHAVAEYTILPPEPVAEKKPRRRKVEAAEPAAVAVAAGEAPALAQKKPAAAAKPAKGAKAAKPAKAATSEKKKPSKAAEKKPTTRAKSVKSTKK